LLFRDLPLQVPAHRRSRCLPIHGSSTKDSDGPGGGARLRGGRPSARAIAALLPLAVTLVVAVLIAPLRALPPPGIMVVTVAMTSMFKFKLRVCASGSLGRRSSARLEGIGTTAATGSGVRDCQCRWTTARHAMVVNGRTTPKITTVTSINVMARASSGCAAPCDSRLKRALASPEIIDRISSDSWDSSSSTKADAVTISRASSK
jgi:hypothetical protein